MPEIIGGCSRFTLPSSNVFHRMVKVFPNINGTHTASDQALTQIMSLSVTSGFAMLGGIIVGKNQGTSITLQ